MTKTVLALCALNLAVAVGAGFGGGYYAAINTPAPSPIAVLDVEALAKSIDVNAPDYTEKAMALADHVKQITSHLVAANVIVIDRASIIDAPEAAIVRLGQ